VSNSDWQAVIAVRVPLVDAGQRAIDMRRAGIQVEQTQETYDKFRETVQEEVTGAFVLVRTLRETIEALEAQVAAEAQAYLDTQTQYRAGTARRHRCSRRLAHLEQRAQGSGRANVRISAGDQAT